MISTGRWLAAAPVVPVAVLEDESWDRLSDQVLAWIDQGRERARHRALWSRWFRAEAEEDFWVDVIERRSAQAGSVLRFLRPSWHADGKRIGRALRDGADPTVEEQLRALRALTESTRLRAAVELELKRFRDLLRDIWDGIDGDWEVLEQRVRTVQEAHRLTREGQLAWPAARGTLSQTDRGALGAAIDASQAAVNALQTALGSWCATLQTTPHAWLEGDPATAALATLQKRLEPMPDAIEALEDWALSCAAIERCQGPRLERFLAWTLSPQGRASAGRFKTAFERQFWSLYADRALGARDTLREFRGGDHTALIESFRKADVEWILITRRRLIRQMRQRQPDVERSSQRESRLGQLKAQMKLKRGGVSLRKLFEATGDVIQAIKPCFMMSPISVAQYLAPGASQFDVVIFDEASQVEPADAFGAIARGRQLLLIGDDNQLPPTNFFNRAQAEASTEDAEVTAADQESILDVGRTALPDSSVCSLRWHYRSLHQSLISFSNDAFYDGKLRVFPSPHADRSELGLVLHPVPRGVYLRGKGQYNPVEARTVVDAVIAHARRSPGVSLGVGAFSSAQQRAIEDELERQRRHLASEDLERFFSPTNPEPFFVKNLETIQGDERDVIFLSIGYGKDADGHLTMNFGPLNRDGGWRRLNVLVKRARRRCEVFSSIGHDDIRADVSRGVAALKDYLRVAALGMTDSAPLAEAESTEQARFEDAVARALVERGYAVRVRVGAAGFHLAVAVVDPDLPGRYLLGIECDGETYVNAATARDRDRLRAEVLAGLGWNVARVWAADWFRQPALMIDQLAQTLEELRRAPRRESEPKVQEVGALPALPPAEEDEEDAEQVTLTGAAPTGLIPYVSPPARALGSLEDLLALPDAQVQLLVHEVVEAEAPVHEEQVIKVIAAWFDTKAAARARAKIRKSVQACVARGLLDRREQFLWRRGEASTRVRFRGGDCPVTRPDHIAIEELAAAAVMVLEREFALPKEAMVQATLRLLGFRRAGARLVEAAEQAVDWLLLNGQIRHDDRGAIVPAGAA